MSDKPVEASAESKSRLPRSTIYLVDPRELVVRWERNISRGGQPIQVDDALISLARDMKPRQGEDGKLSSGQLQPVVCRPVPGKQGQLEVVGGYRRLRAALWLVESGECPDFTLKYTISRLTDAEAALANISENLQREEPKPIQMAHAIRTLTEDYGMTGKDIAARLKKSEAWVSATLKLVQVAPSIQAEIAADVIPATAGHELAKSDETTQKAIVATIKATGGKVTADAVKKVKRDAQEAAQEATPETKAGKVESKAATSPGAAKEAAKPSLKPSKAEDKPIPRTWKDLKTFLVDEGTALDSTPRGKAVAQLLLDYMAGTKSEKAFTKEWSALLD